MPPPICRAAPSRPALPPHRWVMTVDTKITGTSSPGTCSPKWTEAMTSLVPFPSVLVIRYSPTMARPPTGIRYSTHEWARRTCVAVSTPMWNREPMIPPTSPMTPPSTIHFSSVTAYCPMWATRSFSRSMSRPSAFYSIFISCLLYHFLRRLSIAAAAALRNFCQAENLSAHLTFFIFPC